MASLTDILSSLQNGVVAANAFVKQTTGTLNNIFSQLVSIRANARIRLTSPFTLFVSTTGSDTANNGLSAGSPFRTIGHAAITLSALYDVAQQPVSIQCADGTYNENLILPNILGASLGGGLGSANPTLIGNIATPSNCVINGSGVVATIAIIDAATNDWIVRGFKITNSGTGVGIEADAGSWIRLGEMEYGAVGGGSHFISILGATIETMANYKISAGGITHIQTTDNGRFVSFPVTVTLTGTPNFSAEFTLCNTNSLQDWTGVTFSGAATGIRFINDTGGGLRTGGAGINFFPGNAPGTTTAPGWYT